MRGEKAVKVVLYTLCVEGAAIAVCALESSALKKDSEGAIRDAFFEAWLFGGGDIRQLVDRHMVARPPTEEEGEIWDKTAAITGKPIVVLGGEAMGIA